MNSAKTNAVECIALDVAADVFGKESEMTNSKTTHKHNRITKLLLGHGGTRVIYQDTNFDKLLCTHGKLYKPTKPKKVKGGLRNRCHRNASALFLLKYPKYRIATGYALADDGLWRRHSWLMEKNAGVETTYHFELYYGVTLNDSETGDFVIGELCACCPKMMADPNRCRKTA